MKKMRAIVYTLSILFLSLGNTFGQEQDKFLQLLKQELQYNARELEQQELPPYYMNFRVIDEQKTDIVSAFGTVLSSSSYRMRMFVPQIRLGSPEADNFKLNPMGTSQVNNYSGSLLPLDDDGEAAIRDGIWKETLKRYRFAKDMYKQMETQSNVSVEGEDKSPCFSPAPVEGYYEAPLAEEKRGIDVEEWKKRLNEISAVFKGMPDVLSATVSLNFQVERRYLVNTEGSEIVQNRTYARVMLSAIAKAADGMVLPLNKDYFAYEVKDLPDNEVMIAGAREMITKLKELKDAPVVDPYTGPAILSGAASGVFFHEIFGHRLEASRLKTGGETFKKMVGEQVLPIDFQVYCDPTLTRYAGTYLNGYYLYDDEGVKSRRVDNVVNGVLKEFLLGRNPIDGFPESNAHGRTAGGGDAVARQSNLIVETIRPYSEAELREMLIKEAKKQEKEYGYYFKEVTGGFTYTGEGNSLNSFNVNPVEVYRVYVDGRPDELVRGVDLIGTPLSMFSNIVAGGDKSSVFTGMCGAESGWVPVTACSPMIFVSKIETQRRNQERGIPPILPAP